MRDCESLKAQEDFRNWGSVGGRVHGLWGRRRDIACGECSAGCEVGMSSLWMTHVSRDKSENVRFKAESGAEAVNAEEQGSLGKLGIGLSVQTSVPGDDEGRRSHAGITLGPAQAEAPTHLMYLFPGQSPL